MSRILLHTLREHGHLLPTLKLARALEAAGHAVEYLLTPSWRGFAATHGVAIRTYLEEIFPEGSETAWQGMDPAARAADADARGQRRIAWLLAGGLDAVYRAAAPDLILGDVYDVSIPIVARRLGIPVVQLSPTVFQGRVDGVPPLTSGLEWGDGPEHRAAAEAAWERHDLRAVSEAYTRYVDSLVEVYGFPGAEISWQGAIAPDFPGLPQLVLAPRALELPGALPSRCRADVACVSVAGEELEAGLAGWLEGQAPVYCALGSQGLWRPQYRRLYAQVLALAAARPELRFVVACGEEWAAELSARAPENARVLAWAPQHALLRRAAAAISVGGLGTIKECMLYGAPMVLVPALNPYDGPGNAARVVHHGLGAAISVAAMERGGLAAALDRALAGEFNKALQDAQAAVQAVEDSDAGPAAVAMWLRGESTEETRCRTK